jgi:ribonuclease HI
MKKPCIPQEDTMKQVSIYTDGSCSGNPGPGGYAAILQCGQNGFDEHTRELAGGEPITTNNRMELRAIVAGLEAIKAAAEITIYTDSLYAIGAFSGNKVKKNADLISAGLLKIQAIKNMGGTVTFQHVNGHAGDVERFDLNERCDKLARQQTAIENAFTSFVLTS